MRCCHYYQSNFYPTRCLSYFPRHICRSITPNDSLTLFFFSFFFFCITTLTIKKLEKETLDQIVQPRSLQSRVESAISRSAKPKKKGSVLSPSLFSLYTPSVGYVDPDL
ncbi:hypothetical protein BCR43DRAFT_481899 [Syncephalastrum racemosum]|uniref:Uncharacterized protein n=1 Tax=Syncephalastrum racemosum TaxID=13706 RepID=A0A1X2HSU8_SYNRA|nr:hypothetical protein BCR43DRAFT_481899 [Syncephalastrum racemosum]